MLYNHKIADEKEMPLHWRTFSELSYLYPDWKRFGDYAAEDN